jgi:hypothetical protein
MARRAGEVVNANPFTPPPRPLPQNRAQAGFTGIEQDAVEREDADRVEVGSAIGFVTPGPPVTTASNQVKHGTLRGPAAPWAASRHSFSYEERLPL